jgi:hypothetical protein
MAAVIPEWALSAWWLWSKSPAAINAQLRQQVSGLQLEVATVQGERDEIDRQRDRLANRVDKLIDALGDLRRRIELELE